MLARRLLVPPLILALELGGCSPAGAPGRSIARREPIVETEVIGDAPVDAATAPSSPPPAPSSPPPAPSPSPATKLCTADDRDDEPWAALRALLARSPVPESFHCPAAFRLAPRRPWSQDSLVSTRGRAGEVFEFVGEDPASGDVVLATLARLDAVSDRDRAGDLRRRDAHAYFILLPEEPSRPRALAGPTLDEGRWVSERFAAREAATIAGPLAWLQGRPADAVIDVVALGIGDLAGDEAPRPAILHHHAGATLTICARASELRCWTRSAIRRSAIEAEREGEVRFAVEPESGGLEIWTIDEALALKPAPELAAATTSAPWIEAAAVPPELAAIFAGPPRIRTLRPGAVALGHYETLGHATIVRAPITDWILQRQGDSWAPIATPAMILDALVDLGPALGVVERRRLVSEAGSADSLRLLGFAPRGAAWSFVGQLPLLVGERFDNPRGEFAWTHTIEVSAGACVRLGPGPHEGVTFDLETEEEVAIDARIRARFKATRGRWTVAADGWRRGCGRPRR